jgi:hypothetical protein
MRNLATIALLALATTSHAERFVEVTFGLSPSKSILGASWTWDRNELNAGLKGFWYQTSTGYEIQPGLSYNRYLTLNEFYGSVTYAPLYRDEEHSYLRTVNGTPVVEVVKTRGWETGSVLIGAGKVFRGRHWGFHADVNFGTPANAAFGTDWSWIVGAGLSYRFRID